jgi:tetratricopeptide (TPR) repeat protein
MSREQAKAKYLASGNRYYEVGKYPQARSMYGKAIKADRRFGEAYYRAGLTAMKLQSWPESVWYLQRAVELQPEHEDAYAQLANVFCFAYNAMKSQPSILKELTSLSDRLHERFPGTFDDERIGGYVALFSNDPKGGLEHLERANRIKPNQEEVILAIVRTLLAMGRAKEADGIAARAVVALPGAIPIYDALMAYYLRSGHPQDLERISRLKVQNNPNFAGGYLELAAQCYASADLAQMGSVLRPLLDRMDIPDGPLLLGDFFLRIRDWSGAAEQYRRGLNLGSKRKPSYQKRLIEVLVKQKKFSEAQQLVDVLVKENPADPEAIALRASLPVLGEDKARIPAAVKDFEQVIGQLPDDFVLRYTYARALMDWDDINQAVVYLKQALQLRPDYIWPRVTLAFISLGAGDDVAAVRLSREILALNAPNIPFDTAGQRPQERPLYDEILGIKPDARTALSQLAEALASKKVGPDEVLAMSRLAREQVPGAVKK